MISNIAQQAKDYVARVGLEEARRSNHYLTALRHCACGECFCCEVKKEVENKKGTTNEQTTI